MTDTDTTCFYLNGDDVLSYLDSLLIYVCEITDCDNIYLGGYCDIVRFQLNLNESSIPFADHHHTISRMSPGTMSCLSPGSMIRLLLQHKLGYLYKTEKHSKQHRRHVNHYQYDEDDLLDIDVNALEITPTDFSEIICPALLTQVERAECVKKVDPTGMDGNIKSEKKLFQFAWLYATISILIISMCGLVGVAIVPLTKSSSYNYILMFLVAVAVGTLAGDALMHLLPHALTPHLDHGDDTLPTDHKNNEAVFLCAFAFLAAIFMFILEALLPILLTGNNRGHGHAHHHHHPPPKAGRTRRSSSIIHEEMTLEPGKIPERDQEADLNINMSDDHNGEKKVEGAPLSPIAFMVIIGDGLHNITDGLAIGAAFAYDPITGMATALAVLCHELPHELGDFALLLKTGMSIKRALILNVISSVLSLFGMAFGLVIAGIHTSLVRWIYAATAGTFLYIAMADLIPEMSREPEGKTMKSVLCQVSGILIGGLIMLTIALNEDRLRILFE